MSYESALEAAGAKILEFKEFGSYQGDWWALVSYKGELGWVCGSYGSCSGCDAFQAEFDFSDRDQCEEHRWKTSPPDCLECKVAHDTYTLKLADFGRSYLDGLLISQEQAEKDAGRNIEWDTEAQEMLNWVKACGAKHGVA